MLHILNILLSPIVLTFQGRMSDQIRKPWQSFSYFTLSMKENAQYKRKGNMNKWQESAKTEFILAIFIKINTLSCI